jgi:hypothetical protein
MDDINVLATPQRRLETIHDRCFAWARIHGAKFSPEGFEVGLCTSTW